VKDGGVDVRDTAGDLPHGADGGVVAADVDGGQVAAGQDEADDPAVDVDLRVALAILQSVHGGHGGDDHLAAVQALDDVGVPGGQALHRRAEALGTTGRVARANAA
jgi:hypothetical protein